MSTNDQAPQFGAPQTEYEADCLNRTTPVDGLMLCLTVLFVGATCLALLVGRKAALLGGMIALLCLTNCATKPRTQSHNAKPHSLGAASAVTTNS